MAASAHTSHGLVEWLHGADVETARIGAKEASQDRLVRTGHAAYGRYLRQARPITTRRGRA